MGLMDFLAKKADTEYISDLKYLKDFDEIKSIIKRISPDDYSLAEWNDAVHYFTGVNKQFTTALEAKNFLSE